MRGKVSSPGPPIKVHQLTKAYPARDSGTATISAEPATPGCNLAGGVRAFRGGSSFVGWADKNNQQTRAFIFTDGVMNELSTLGRPSSHAWAVNDAGIAVGSSATSDNRYRAFRYENGVMSGLGTLGGGFSSAYDVNAAGVIVGSADTASFVGHASVYRDGIMTDLAPFLASLDVNGRSEAWGINDRGDIVGMGEDSAGSQIASVLLVPEPSSAGLFVAEFFAVARLASRRRRKRG